jgi:hypothetical protein
MTPFHRHIPHPVEVMVKRDILLSQPDSFFAPLLNGRAPTLQERLHYVEIALQRITCHNVWENDTYRVEVAMAGKYIHLDISRHDAQPIVDRVEFQRIKNELVGPEHEAVQLFPSDSRLVDTANQYHLWVHADPAYRFPVGYRESRTMLDQLLRAHQAKAHAEEAFPSALAA